MKHKVCSICDIEIQENYCTRCGQKYTAKKLSVYVLISDFISNFFSMDKSGFATIIKVLVQPKKVVQNYSLGFRNYYTSPANILLYGIAIITLHLFLVDGTIMNFKVGGKALSAQYGFLIAFYPYLMVISYFSFIRKKITFSELLVSISYTSTSLLIVITIISDIIYLITAKLFEIQAFWVFVILSLIYNSLVFTDKKGFKYLLLNTLLQIVVFIVIIGIILLLSLTLSNQ